MTSTSAQDAIESVVSSVNSDSGHHFTKQPHEKITLLRGLGVEGDAHLGSTVQHRSRVAIDPTAPNLRQVHLIHSELFAEVAEAGFALRPGELGENVTTAGIDLLALPRGSILELGDDAQVEITGLRNPCVQIDTFQPGLLKLMVSRDREGTVVRKAGVMGVILRTGVVRPGDGIVVRLPPEPHEALERV
jgi:MOSC domain-containing protein YiiM